MNSVVSLTELGQYCAEHCIEHVVTVQLKTLADGYYSQQLTFGISGAEEFELLEEIYCTLSTLYTTVTIEIVE